MDQHHHAWALQNSKENMILLFAHIDTFICASIAPFCLSNYCILIYNGGRGCYIYNITEKMCNRTKLPVSTKVIEIAVYCKYTFITQPLKLDNSSFLERKDTIDARAAWSVLCRLANLWSNMMKQPRNCFVKPLFSLC